MQLAESCNYINCERGPAGDKGNISDARRRVRCRGKRDSAFTRRVRPPSKNFPRRNARQTKNEESDSASEGEDRGIQE